jgi:hypothetical protein
MALEAALVMKEGRGKDRVIHLSTAPTTTSLYIYLKKIYLIVIRRCGKLFFLKLFLKTSLFIFLSSRHLESDRFGIN